MSMKQGIAGGMRVTAVKVTAVKVTVVLMALTAVTLLLSACGVAGIGGGWGTSGQTQVLVPGGNPDRGVQALQEYGCVSCHTIPGVPRGDSLVGPPLNHWAERRYIAGRMANTPENLIMWIRVPQSVDPGNAMPDMGVTEQDARDMAAYLYTLQRGRWFER
jgi:cytochrome c